MVTYPHRPEKAQGDVHPDTKDIPVSRRMKKTWNGVMGVILPATATSQIPDGCTKMYKKVSRVVESATTVADSWEAIRPEQYAEAHEEAKKRVAVSKKGPLQKFTDQEGRPAPVTLCVPVRMRPDENQELFSSILPDGGLLECGLSGSDNDDPTTPKKPKKTETPKKGESSGRKDRDSKIGIVDQTYRKLKFQVLSQLCRWGSGLT